MYDILRVVEIWLGRSFWLFLLIFFLIGRKVTVYATGIDPLGEYGDTSGYLWFCALLSLGIAAVTMLMVSRKK